MTTFVDRARMTVASAPGTGAITLGAAVPGFRSFAAAGLTDGQSVTYVAEDTNNAWEVGTGVYTASGAVLARTLIASSTGALLSLSAAAQVYVTIGAADANTWDAIVAEVVEARKTRSTLGRTVGGVISAASGSPGAVLPNKRYVVSRNNTALSQAAAAADRWDSIPWYCPATVQINDVGIECTTAVAGALGKITVYDADPLADWPTDLLLETADLDLGTTGFKSVSTSLTFDAGKWYWFGLRTSSTAAVRVLGSGAGYAVGRSGGAGTTIQSGTRRTLAYSTAAPAAFGFANADLANISGPAIIFQSVTP